MTLAATHPAVAQDVGHEWPEGSAHEKWLAYTQADCELAGTLTGAGASWPIVHGLGCHAQAVEERLEIVRSATACLQQLDAGAPDFDRLECLQGLAAWSMQPG